jgi:hypothetical protein
MNNPNRPALASKFEADLTAKYGLMLSSQVLGQVLGYKTPNAFRQALARKTVPVPVFRIPNRRGHFALAKDVADWLAHCRTQARNGHDGNGSIG